MARSKQDLLAEAAKLEKQIEAGKFSGKKRAKMMHKKNYLRFRARKSKSNTAIKVKKAKALKPVDPKQGFIPGFLAQLNTVRIEELIADRAFQAMKPKLEEALGIQLSDLVKVG